MGVEKTSRPSGAAPLKGGSDETIPRPRQALLTPEVGYVDLERRVRTTEVEGDSPVWGGGRRTVRRPQIVTPFTKAELAGLQELASLDASALAARLDRWKPAEIVHAMRRAMILSLGVRDESEWSAHLDVTLPDGVERADVRASSYFAERIEKYLAKRLTDDDRRALRASGRLFPYDQLVDPRLGISGAGLMKSLDFQTVDRLIDGVLGVDHEAAQVRGQNPFGRDQEVYWQLPPAMLYTSYLDLQAALEATGLERGETVVDLGSGIGRLGLLMAFAYPGTQFVGYEIVESRATEAQRVAEALEIDDVARTEIQDLAHPDFVPVEADHYFMYDPVSEGVRAKILADLEGVAKERDFSIIAIEGMGTLFRTLSAQPWLVEGTDPNAKLKTRVFRTRTEA